MDDMEINCSDCNTSFLFSASEQAFFEEKGFTPPKRCKPCRDKRKANGAGGGSSRGSGDRPARSGGGGGDRRDDREFFEAVCAQCGVDTRVPFKPSGDRPVYCRDCFKIRSPAR